MLAKVFNLITLHPSRLKLTGGLLVLGVILLAVALPLPSGAGLSEALSGLLASLILVFANFLGNLTLALIRILLDIAQYNDFINATAVVKGWVIVRDVCNMFFIVALLAMAFGTVFRVEEYGYKHILGKLLLMAVLINFSKSITGVMIDIAQVIMLTFVNGFKEAAEGNFVNGFHLTEMFEYAKNENIPSLDGTKLIVAAILAFVSIAITTIVVGVYVAMFLVRIVALWFLIVISPLAYLLSAFPGEKAKEYSHEWWDYFGKYATTGPILAFFLWLSLAVMQFSNNNVIDFAEDNQFVFSPTSIGQSGVLMSFLLNIILLIGGLWMAQHLGVIGGGLAGGAMHMMQSAGKKIGKGALNVGGLKGTMQNWYNEKAPAWANPAALYRGFKERRKQKDEEAKTIAAARGREFVTKVMTGGKVQIPYEDIAQRHLQEAYTKDLGHLTKEQKGAVLAKVWNKKGPEGERMRAALLTSAASESHIDDILATTYFRKEAEWTDAKGKKHKGFQDEKGVFSDFEKINNLFYSGLGDSQNGLRTIHDIGELGRKINHYELYGHAGYDADKGAFKSHQAGKELDDGYEREIEKDGKSVHEKITDSEYEAKSADEKKNYKKYTHDHLLEEASNEAIGELIKVSSQNQLGLHPHNYQQQVMKNFKGKEVFQWGGEDEYFGKKAYNVVFAGADANNIKRYTTSRAAYTLGNYDPQEESFKINVDDNETLEGLKRRVELGSNSFSALKAIWDRVGAKQISSVDKDGDFIDKDGKKVSHAEEAAHWTSLEDFAGYKGWNIPPPKPPSSSSSGRKSSQNTAKPLVDIDPEKQATTSQAFENYQPTEGESSNFFESNEYKNNKDKYYSEDEFTGNRIMEDYQAGKGGGLSFNSFVLDNPKERKKERKNEIAVDFSQLNMPDLIGKAGITLTGQGDIVAAIKELTKVLQNEKSSIGSKSQKTQLDTWRLQKIEKALRRMDNPSGIPNLTLYNTGRQGVQGKQLIMHERSHIALSIIDPSEKVQNNLWQN
ncbi:MAG: MFS transporter, partial [Patescibacteria group bacterium]